MKRSASLLPAASLTLALLLGACGSLSSSGSRPSEGRAQLVSWSEPAPAGMLLIPRGHVLMGRAEADSLWGEPAQSRGISVEAFWMDRTEVTNAAYREFVHWVRDSILRERLADPAYGGDERYRITEDRYGEPVRPHLDWSRPLPSERRATEEELRALRSLYYTDPVTGERRLDPRQLNYRYERYDRHAATLYRDRLHRAQTHTAWDRNPTEHPIISKDTAYLDASGRIVRETLTRPLSSEYDFVSTYIIPVLPDETVWVKDFPEARNEGYSKKYFEHAGYDQYPVVGVSWEQATAYCAWRTAMTLRALRLPEGQTLEEYRLPTEAEWEYAAQLDKEWGKHGVRQAKGKVCFVGNFKPGDGDYTADRHLITAPVASYAPNAFGLYDMAGNVAEWTSTSWSASGLLQTSDVNPELRRSVSYSDPLERTLKVLKGGSWKDIARFIQSSDRSPAAQTAQHAYIGFRCVRSAITFGK